MNLFTTEPLLRSNDHLWTEWLPIAIILPDAIGRPCQCCGVEEATHCNYDDERGTLLYCTFCTHIEYEPEASDGWTPVPDPTRHAVVAFIHERGAVTFPQLARFLSDHGIRVEGKQSLGHPDNPFQRLWGKMSNEMADLVWRLHRDGTIQYVPTSWQPYLLDAIGDPSANAGLPSVDRWRPVLMMPRSP